MTVASPDVLTLRIELEHIEPLIWRRILVPAAITLPALHSVCQAAMGWTNSHLHLFRIGDCSYGEPDEFGELNFVAEKGRRLEALVGRSIRQFHYEYDFGDSWEHRIIVEEDLPVRHAIRLPLCTAGQRACPPEDVGGPPGYENFLDAIRDPSHEEHDDYLQWIGGFFDPEGFDVNAVNQRLAKIRFRQRNPA